MKKMEIYYDDNAIYDVVVGNKHSDHLGFDEALGLVAAVIMPKSRPCLQWLKTEEEREKESMLFESYKNNRLDFEIIN